jgi:hypothetical protein
VRQVESLRCPGGHTFRESQKIPSLEFFPGRGQVVDPWTADFDRISDWLKFCRKYHIQFCSIPVGETVLGLQLIDCQGDNKVILATQDMKYVALSYVWGADSGAGVSPDGHVDWKQLPQTVCDAIHATRRLGFRYLWVDRYCIPAISQLKQMQIRKMDIIYRQSQATLIQGGDNLITSSVWNKRGWTYQEALL